MNRLFAILLLASACVEPVEPIELPSDLERFPLAVAALATPDGTIVGASGVFSTATGTPPLVRHTLETAAANWTVYGFDTIASLPAELPTVAMTMAKPNDPTLPRSEATWVRARDGSWSIGEPAVPNLTAAWIPECPELIPRGTEAFVDRRCTPIFCQVRVRQRGCILERSTDSCHAPPLPAGVLNAKGELPAAHLCKIVDDGPEAALASLMCDTCRLDLAPVEPPRFGTASLELQPGAMFTGKMDSGGADRYIFGMARVGDRVVVGTHGTEAQSFNCASATLSTLNFLSFDGSAPTIVATATAPPCLRKLAALPSGFVGLFGGTPEPILLIRFDDEGRTHVSVELDDVVGLHPIDIEVLGTPPVIAVATGESEEDLGKLATFDPNSLQRIRIVDLPDFASVLERVSDSIVATGAPRQHRIRLSDLSTLQVTEEVDLQNVADRGPDELTFVPAVNRVVASSAGTTPALHITRLLDDKLFQAGVGFGYEYLFSPGAGVASADGAGLVIAGTARHQWDTYVSDFDPVDARFLPGATKIGRGVSTEAVRIDDTRVWFVLPWSGHVVQVTRK